MKYPLTLGFLIATIIGSSAAFAATPGASAGAAGVANPGNASAANTGTISNPGNGLNSGSAINTQQNFRYTGSAANGNNLRATSQPVTGTSDQGQNFRYTGTNTNGNVNAATGNLTGGTNVNVGTNARIDETGRTLGTNRATTIDETGKVGAKSAGTPSSTTTTSGTNTSGSITQ